MTTHRLRMGWAAILAVAMLVAVGCGQSAPPAAKAPADSKTAAVAPAPPEVPKTKYPERTITMIIPYAAGGNTDIMARSLAKAMEKTLGQTIVIQNKAGGEATVGVADLAKSKNDGYTLGVITLSGVAMTPHTRKLPYVLDDFEYVGSFGEFHYGFMVGKTSPYKTMNDAIADAKANPGKVNFGHQGLPGVIAMGLLKRETGATFTPVPFPNNVESRTALMGNHIKANISSPTGFETLIQDGDLKLLAVIGGPRWRVDPKVPTLKELGYNVDVTSTMGLAAPKGVPAEVLQKIMDAFRKGLDDAEFKKFGDQADLATDKPLLGKDFKDFIYERNATFGGILKELGLAEK